MFQSTKRDLREILRDARDGRLQLPDFQRSYVWADPDVRSLIASIGRGFPVGALLTLETGGEVRFKPRPIEGVVAARAPDVLLLDGQQRITSLYHALMSPAPIRTRTERGKEVQRYYYLDIAKSIDLSSRMEEAVVSVDENLRMVGSFGETIFDLSEEEASFERHLFPLNRSFDEREWFYKWRDHWRARGRDVFELDRDFHQKVLDRIQRYEMPIIALDRSNSREAICLVFEKVNVGGKKLDAFELVTAIYAADEYNLREDWWGGPRDRGRHHRLLHGANRRDVLKEVTSLAFLDFIDGQPTDLMTFFNKSIDVHHVFPKAWCRSQGLDPARFNSIINKTPLSAETNRRIGGRAPSRYLRTIERDSGMAPAELDDIIRTHGIEPEYLRNDDFEGFFRSREVVLLTLIEREIGKPVIDADDVDAEAPADDDDEDEAA